MQGLRIIIAAMALGILAFALITLLALEGQEVAIIRTVSPAGQERVTRVWIADEGDVSWIEAASPERPFYRDIMLHPEVTVERGGRREALRARVVSNTRGHRHVRELLREKYGLADLWIGLLQNTSRSVAVRLEPPELP